MSGGHFNYLCSKNAAAILDGSAQDDLQAMALALQSRQDGAEVADATFAVLKDARESMQRLQSGIDRLCEVWKALEWQRSGDWSEQRVRNAILDYRSKNKAQSTPGASAVQNFEGALLHLVEEDAQTALCLLTGAFVGLTLELIRLQGHEPVGDVFIDGGESRDITIHAAKKEVASG